MCIRYVCRGCKSPKILYCKYADWNQVDPGCHRPTTDPKPHKKRKKCYHCYVIEGAIRELHALVFKEPWLETEGLSGAENRPAWELHTNSNKNENTICWNQESDNELIRRLRAMGLDGLDGRNDLNDGHGIGKTVDSDEATIKDEHEVIGSGQQGSTWCSDEGTVTSIVANKRIENQEDKN